MRSVLEGWYFFFNFNNFVLLKHLFVFIVSFFSGSIPEEEEWNENDSFQKSNHSASDESLQRESSEEK